MNRSCDLVLTGIATELGPVRIKDTELSLAYSNGRDKPREATGITALHRFHPHASFVGHTANTVSQSLRRAGVLPGDVGGLVATSNFTHDTLVPTFGPAVAARAGLADIRAATIGTGCGGLAQAVEYAVSMMTSPFMGWDPKKVFVIVAGDAYTRHVDINDYKTRYLFSEGIATFVLRFKQATKGDLVVARVASRSLVVDEPLDALLLGNPAFYKDRYFRMQTAPIVRFTRQVLGIAQRMLALESWSGVTIIPHQANARLLDEMGKSAPEAHLFYTNGIATIGNTLNASTVFGLEDALTNLSVSDDIVLVPFGAEWVVGAIQLHRHP